MAHMRHQEKEEHEQLRPQHQEDKSSTVVVAAPLLLTVDDYHDRAKQLLPKMCYDYYASGADQMITLALNELHFQHIRLRPRMLVDVSHVDTRVSLLSSNCVCPQKAPQQALSTKKSTTTIPFPIMIAPTAMQRMAHEHGELATARAASKLGTVFTLSSLSTTSMRDVAQVRSTCENESVDSGACGAAPQWFQLYITKDRNLTRQLVRNAEQYGYGALVLTVDAPKLGNRLADHHNRFQLPDGLSLVNLMDALKQQGSSSRSGRQDETGDRTESGANVGVNVRVLDRETEKTVKQSSALNQYFQTQIDASLTWKDIQWLKSLTKLPIILKGILTAEDAMLAVHYGVQGIVVSNHGARQVDTSVSSIEALPEVVRMVRSLGAQDRIDVYLDGGIRHGTDVLKALALGAKAVFIGRPVIWGLTVAGEQGVMDVLSILRRELLLAMQLCGCPDVKSISSSLLHMPQQSRL